MTSYDDGDLHAAGYRLGVSDLVEARAQQAQVLGIDGLVCSPEEAASLRKIVGHQMVLVTPGIRPGGFGDRRPEADHDAGRAIAAGADYLVVGRPVLEAADPKAAAEAIQAEIAQALALTREGKRRWQRATGSRASMFTTWTATRNTSRRTARCFKKYGAKFLVRGGKYETREGTSRSRNVVLEFKDYETALACYNSPEYPADLSRSDPRRPHAEASRLLVCDHRRL